MTAAFLRSYQKQGLSHRLVLPGSTMQLVYKVPRSSRLEEDIEIYFYRKKVDVAAAAHKSSSTQRTNIGDG